MAGKLPIAVLISGRGSNLQALIDFSKRPEAAFEIKLVLSNIPDVYGLERAAQAGIPTVVLSHKDYRSREGYDEAVDHEIQAKGCEFVCLAGFMRLLSPWFCEKWTGKMVNIHPSLLPAFKGLHVHDQALAAGVRFSGCTVHFVTADLDGGPIIGQAVVPVLPHDDAGSLGARVLLGEHLLYPAVVQGIAQHRIRYQDSAVSFHGFDFPQDGLLSPAVAGECIFSIESRS